MMSPRAQIAIQIGPEDWAHVYVHFDGYLAHMLPVLTRWKPEDVLNPTGPAPVLFRSFESDTRHQGDRIWQRYTVTSSSVMRFASRRPVA
jgi:hypothetical protein